MKVRIRKFERSDIPYKVDWVNNPLNNKYLHYELPLSIENTEQWFDTSNTSTDRFDATILVDEKPVGVLGLLQISDSCAEFYIMLGEVSFQGKGVASIASKLLIEYAFNELKLKKLYLTTEPNNKKAIKLYDRIGFVNCGEKNGQLYLEYANPEN